MAKRKGSFSYSRNYRRRTRYGQAVGASGRVTSTAYNRSGRYTGRYSKLRFRSGRYSRRSKYGWRRKKSSSFGGHNDQTSTKFKLVLGRYPIRNAAKGKLIYHENYQTVIQGIEGRQSAYELRHMLTAKSFVAESVVRNDRVSQTPAYFDLDANQYATGAVSGPLYSTIPQQVTSLMRRLNVHSCWTDMNITNMQNSAATVYVFFFLAKSDSQFGPWDYWNADCNMLDYFQSPNQYSTTTADPNWDCMGTRPDTLFTYPNTLRVKRYFKTLKVCKMELDGGASHRLKFQTVINRVIAYSEAEIQNSANNQWMRGLTVTPLVIVQGSPVGVNDEPGATTASEITTSAPKIGVTMSRTYKFSTPKDVIQTPVKFLVSGLVSYTGSHVYGPKLIDDEDSVADVVKV